VAFGLTVGLGFGLGVVVELWVLGLAWALHPMGLGFAVDLPWVLGEHNEEEKRNEEKKKVKIK
jgi:hypothetical protein